MASRMEKSSSDIIADAQKTAANATEILRDVNAFFAELRDGFENQGWYIVKPNGGGKSHAPKQPTPRGTDKGYDIIRRILENA